MFIQHVVRSVPGMEIARTMDMTLATGEGKRQKEYNRMLEDLWVNLQGKWLRNSQKPFVIKRGNNSGGKELVWGTYI